MEIQKCTLCGTTSQDTAIFTALFCKEEMKICLSCLSEGILEQLSQKDPLHLGQDRPEHIIDEEKGLFTFEPIEEIYGLNCPKCKKPIFTEIFPIKCDECGETIKAELKDILERK